MSRQVPQSIVGTWALDPSRTLEHFFDQLGIDPAVRPQTEPQTEPQVVIFEITEDQMTSIRDGVRHVSTYRIIGGNAGTVIVESTENGRSSIGTIHLVEGGFWLETVEAPPQRGPIPGNLFSARATEDLFAYSDDRSQRAAPRGPAKVFFRRVGETPEDE